MITVLAGVNGAGKSSVGGSAIRAAGGEWYNPDEVAREMSALFPDKSLQEINGEVWHQGLSALRDAIANHKHFTFETTLGGKTITNTLLDAIACGVPVRIWYCGLSSVELHLERVSARVANGGHDIPEDMIRSRYISSMINLCRLTPLLSELVVFDNSMPVDSQNRSQIRKLLHVKQGELFDMDAKMPDWAKPVAAVCLQHFRPTGS